MRVYLSGGMEYATEEGRGWRSGIQQWLERELGWQVFNPNAESDAFFRKCHPGIDFRALKSTDPALYMHIARHIVERDCAEIEHQTDILICNWDDAAAQGAGTKGEITIAHRFGKPVYLVTPMPLPQIPGWVLGCTTQLFSSLDELKGFLKRLKS